MSAPTELRPGQILVVNCKLYARCPDCQQIIRINKPLIGSLHICVEKRK